MWWLSHGDVVAQSVGFGGSVVWMWWLSQGMWRLSSGDVAAQSGGFGGSVVWMWWLSQGDVAAQ
jgi:hypothetical protein